jgi:hypothetical protein
MTNDNSLPLLSESDCNPVPVFNCHIILSKPDNDGRIQGRTANLGGIAAAGTSERDVLTSLMKQFKAIVQQHSRNNTPIPWVQPSELPGDNEVERFIPVHL